MAPRLFLIVATPLLMATLAGPQRAVAQNYNYSPTPQYGPTPQAVQAPSYYYPQYYPQLAEVPCPCASSGSFYEHEVEPTPAGPVSGTPSLPQQSFDCGPAPGCGQYCSFESCQPQRSCTWYAAAAGLFLDRSEPTRVWTTYQTGNNANQLMNTQDADTDWEGGAEFRLGRFFCCNRWALEASYWSVANFTGSANMTDPNYVSSPLLFNDLEFAVGDPVADYFDRAQEHRLYRSTALHNVEVNFIQGYSPWGGASCGCSSCDSCGCSSCDGSSCGCTSRRCGPWMTQMLAGFRFFRFDDDLTFETLDEGGTWGGNGGLDEVRLSESVTNTLIGAQVGCVMQRQMGNRVRAVFVPKFGVYNNHIENYFDLRRGDGTAAMPSAFSGVSGSYPVQSETDEIAFLSELNAGLQYQITQRCTLVGGYRVVVLTNVGLSDEQIPQYIVDIPEIADIVTTGSLVLHGAYFGGTWCF